MAVIQARDGNSLIQGSSSGENEKWLVSACILKIELQNLLMGWIYERNKRLGDK